jgi:hypothetical protein
MAKSKIKRLFSKWHKRVGISAALFVVMLSLTGIALNHSDAWGLDESYLSAWLSQSVYGIEDAPTYGVQLESEQGSIQVHFQAGQIYLNSEAAFACEQYLGASLMAQNYIVACAERIVWINSAEQILDQYDLYSGLPEMLSSLGDSLDPVCMRAQSQQIYCLDDDFNLQAAPHGQPYSSLVLSPLSASDVPNNLRSQSITLERFLLDMHAGRFFGRAGPLIMDAVAILFLLSALSGIFLWLKKRKPKSRR